MSALIEYFAKLSISLAVVWLFYQFVLRRLTFYNHNRWYLLGYSLLSFVIPLIDITPALHQNDLTDSGVVQWVPLVYKNAAANTSLSVWNILSILVVAGMLFMLIRLLVQLISFRRMMKKATLVSAEGIQLYQVNEPIIPFSFGNAVFFNVNLHTTEELEKIIRHEFVHVKQRHSIDIICSEILCLLNWYNPFAWMIRAAIRQNLEFVADNKVLENGINKKQYQYLLLKVIGDNQFSIAQKFNFSSLKKRIAMMNKNKSTKKHLLRFLFLLPVLAFILVSFRKEIGDTITGKNKGAQQMPAAVLDTIPEVTVQNSKGYIINVKDNNGNCLLVIKDKGGKEVKRMLLTDWNADASSYEAKYGEIPPPPPPAPGLPIYTGVNPMEGFLKRNPGVKDVCWKLTDNNQPELIHIMKTDGKTEVYHVNNKAEWRLAEKMYGSLPYPPPPPPPPSAPPAPIELSVDLIPPAPPIAPSVSDLPENITSVEVKNNKVMVKLKNGQIENYDLNNPAQVQKFESQYGKLLVPPPPPPVNERKVVGVKIAPKVQRIPVEEVKLPDNVLYVLDGVITTAASISEIHPSAIASVDVLKGNSAVALYGEKGKEGVIVIKTKKLTEAELITTSNGLKEVLVQGKPLTSSKSLKEVVVEERPLERKSESTAPTIITVTGKPVKSSNIAKEVVLEERPLEKKSSN
jgi:TonB-dependent SusC/RagA subfamily outer membrane receptor